MKWNNFKWNGSTPDRNRNEIGSNQCQNGTGSRFFQKSKCDVKISTNSILQSNKLEIRRGRKKNFLQQCTSYGSDLTEWCDDGPWRNPRTSQRVPEPPERRKEKTCTSKNADTEPANNQGAACRGENGGLTNEWFASKLERARRQISGEWGRKKTRNLPEQSAENAEEDVVAYGLTRGDNTRVRKQEVPDHASSKSSAPANGKSARLERKHPRLEQ